MESFLNESRQSFIARINVVQDYIENHLDEDITIQKLSKVASFSEYHFQKIFKQFTTESIYSFIKRLRLEKAVFLLRSNKKLSVLDIALSVGFSNQASFAKAIKEKYGICAREVRKMNDFEINRMINENRTNGKVLSNDFSYNIPERVAIRAMEPTNVLYTRYTGAYKGNSDLFSKWLPDSGYLPDDRFCFEHYPPQKIEGAQSRHIVEIFIPIKPL